LIELTKSEWATVLKEVLVVLHKITSTRDERRKSTQADKAEEAVQAAFERLLKTRPAHLDTVVAVRKHLVWAARSALSNAKEAAGARGRTAEAAGIEEAATMRTEAPSAETMNLEAAEQAEAKARDARRLEALKRELKEAGDDLGLEIVGCMERGIGEPAALTAELRCPIEEIHNARKRRQRIVEKILAAERPPDEDDEDGE
jgi:hypothetical protein